VKKAWDVSTILLISLEEFSSKLIHTDIYRGQRAKGSRAECLAKIVPTRRQRRDREMGQSP
jgi:hypothetical protein